MRNEELTRRGAYLGRVGESGHARVWLDVTGWVKEYGEGNAIMVCRRPDGQLIPMETVRQEDEVDTARGKETRIRIYGTVDAEITAAAGTGSIEVRWENDGAALKSESFSTLVVGGMYTGKGPKGRTPDWVSVLLEGISGSYNIIEAAREIKRYRDEAEAYAQAAEESAQAAETAAGTAVMTETVFSVSIPATGWSSGSAPYTRTVSVPGIKETDNPIVDLALSGAYSEDMAMCGNWGKVYRMTTEDDAVTVYAHELPTAAMDVKVRCLRNG